jgi:hypothetical protein
MLSRIYAAAPLTSTRPAFLEALGQALLNDQGGVCRQTISAARRSHQPA